MDLLSVLLTGFIGVVTLVLFYIVYMSKDFTLFKKMGIPYLKPWPALGSTLEITKEGFVEFHKKKYMKFENEKVYGFFEPGRPIMVVRDLDMLREVMVKNFNSFVNRRHFSTEEPFDHAMTMIRDDHWRHVRNTVSPTFSSGKLKRMCLHVEQTSKLLVSNIEDSCKANKPVELKHVLSCYTLDVIASTGFGVTIDSLRDGNTDFEREAKRIMDISNKSFIFLFLFPSLMKFLRKFGYSLFPKQSLNYFSSFVDAAMANRRESKLKQNRHDFLQLVIDESNADTDKQDDKKSSSEENQRKGLSHLDIQGQALIFILAGYDTTATALSFTMYLLAHHKEALTRVQEEIDTALEGKYPCYENVQSLTYLDMCLNEAIRMFPPGFLVDRECTQDCVIQGIKFPKGVNVVIPIIAIFNDPKHFPEPEKFDPERFTPENKAALHPFAFLPFGQGPRNCIGMRLALMEIKIALAAILQKMSPVPCEKSVYPPRLKSFQMQAEDGLWVKFVSRTEE